jgi:hypothetical protein
MGAKGSVASKFSRVLGGIAALCFAGAVCAQSPAVATSASTVRQTDAPQEGCGDSANGDFGTRLAAAYSRALSWNGDPADAEPSWRKGLQAPTISSPPYPFANWPMGGTLNIGYENLYNGPLMDAIWCGSGGRALKDNRFTVYGWIEPGANISTSRTKYNFVGSTGGNWPAAYVYQPNTAQLDQLALYFERTPDEVQTDHFDWGFRLALLYGTDYKFTFSDGLFSNQYLNDGRRLGIDPVMAYLDFYFPQVGSGMNLRVGRYVSVPDIEAQLAPSNYTYSHSLLYTFDPFTQEGVLATFKVNRNWTVQFAVSAGNDTAFWNKPERQFTPAGCVQWVSDSGRDAVYPCLNGYHPILGNNGNFGYDNVQQATTTWYHVFDDKWHMSTEYWSMYQNNVPNVDNAAGAAALAARYPFAFGAPFGAQCTDATAPACRASEHALLNYLNYQFGPRDYVVWRNELFYDNEGQRTGFKSRYYETTLSWNHWLGNAVTIRPELRFDRAIDTDAYDNPSGVPGNGKHNQLMFAIDAIVHF